MAMLTALMEDLALGMAAVAVLFLVYMTFWVSRDLQRRK